MQVTLVFGGGRAFLQAYVLTGQRENIQYEGVEHSEGRANKQGIPEIYCRLR